MINDKIHQIHRSSPNRRRSREAKRPVESREASWRRLRLTWFIRSWRIFCSSLRKAVSSSRSWRRYFWPSDLRLRRKIPDMTKNCMKLSLRFNPLAIKPSVFFLLGFWKFEAELEEEAIGAVEQCENGIMIRSCNGLTRFYVGRPHYVFFKLGLSFGSLDSTAQLGLRDPMTCSIGFLLQVNTNRFFQLKFYYFGQN